MLKCREEEVAVDSVVDKVVEADLVAVDLVVDNNPSYQQVQQDFRGIAAEPNGMEQELTLLEIH